LTRRNRKSKPRNKTRLDRAAREAQIVVFKLGGEEYGIDIGQVREILQKRESTPMPRQPSYMEGVINVRGTIIPVINLKKRFGLQGEDSKHPHIIIVKSGDALVGMLVDAVSEVTRVPQDQIHHAPSTAKSVDTEYLRGICRLDDRLLIYLDVQKVVKAAPTSTTRDARPQEMLKQYPMTAS